MVLVSLDFYPFKYFVYLVLFLLTFCKIPHFFSYDMEIEIDGFSKTCDEDFVINK